MDYFFSTLSFNFIDETVMRLIVYIQWHTLIFESLDSGRVTFLIRFIQSFHNQPVQFLIAPDFKPFIIIFIYFFTGQSDSSSFISAYSLHNYISKLSSNCSSSMPYLIPCKIRSAIKPCLRDSCSNVFLIRNFEQIRIQTRLGWARCLHNKIRANLREESSLVK